jgi:DNA-binding beta-propeller fold protein YncE
VAAWRAEGEALAAKAQSDDNARLANERKDQLGAANRSLRNALYETDMTLVPAEWAGDDLNRFDELMRWRPGPDEADVRGFEWFYWNRQRHGEIRTVALAGGVRDCQAAAFSPDGKRLAPVTVADDGQWELRLWDPATGAVRRTLLKIPAGQVWKNDPAAMVQSRHARIVFSPDGRRVALSVGWLWKAADPARPPDPLHDPPDTADRERYVWDAETCDGLSHLKVIEGGSRFDGLAFGPGGKLLAFAVPTRMGDGAAEPRDRVYRGAAPCFLPRPPGTANVFVWDVDGQKAAWTLSAAGTPRELAFSPDGDRLAVAVSREDEKMRDDANQVQVWDTATRKDPLTFGYYGYLPHGVAFRPDGTQLAVAWLQPWMGNDIQVLSLYDFDLGRQFNMDGGGRTDRGSGTPPVFRPTGGG